jgi:hypothetical protein
MPRRAGDDPRDSVVEVAERDLHAELHKLGPQERPSALGQIVGRQAGAVLHQRGITGTEGRGGEDVDDERRLLWLAGSAATGPW